MSGSRRLQQYSSLRLALCGAAMCDEEMGDVVGGKRRERNDAVYYWDRAEGKAKKARVERYSAKTPSDIRLQSGGYVHCAEVFDERSQAEKFGKTLASGGETLASGGGEETAQGVPQTLEDVKEETAATASVASETSVAADQEGELASGSLGKETKKEKEDEPELASGSRAGEKGKEDPTSGSLGKEAKVEEEDKMTSGRALEKDKELPSLDSSGEEAKEEKEDKLASGRAEIMKEPSSGGGTRKANEQNQGLATGSSQDSKSTDTGKAHTGSHHQRTHTGIWKRRFVCTCGLIMDLADGRHRRTTDKCSIILPVVAS